MVSLGRTAVVVSILLGTGLAHARDDGRYANSPLKPWFESLQSKGGGHCCANADGVVLADDDWDTKDGYIQGYNAQAAVDGKAQIIVAHGLTASMSDHDQFVPLLDQIKQNLDRKPKEASADAGYCSEVNLKAAADREIAAYVAIGRAKRPAEAKRNSAGPFTLAMRDKLRRAGWRSRYRLRKQIVEPVFGQIKQARGFRQFLLRGMQKVTAEWALICTAHNLTKLAPAPA